jgi:proteasome activator subunit 4
MKSLRYIKHRSYFGDPAEMMQGLQHNPLKTKIPIQPSHPFTAKLLHEFKIPVSFGGTSQEPFAVHYTPFTINLTHLVRMFCDKIPQGWLAWSNELELYRVPHPTRSTFLPWEKPSEAAVAAVREVVTKSSFWDKLSTHFSEENHEVVVSQDHISCVKSICKSSSLQYLSVLTESFSSTS